MVTLPTSDSCSVKEKVCMRMCTKLENGILHNRQQSQSVMNGFY